MNTELTVIEKANKVKKHETAFAVYEKSVEIAAKAKVYTGLQLSLVEKVDMDTVDVAFMETALVPVVGLRTLLNTRFKEMEDARKPVTRVLDELKGYMMEPEKSIADDIVRVAGIQDKWEIQKSKRARDAKKKADDEILIAKAKVLRRSELTSAINKEFGIKLTTKVNAMIDAFHAKKADELPAFGKQLSGWVPAYVQRPDHDTVVSVAAGEKYADILVAIQEETFPACRTEWVTRLQTEKNKLIDLIPSRIAELTTEKPEVILQREMNFKQEAQQEIAEDAISKAETLAVETSTGILVTNFALPDLSDIKKAKGSVTTDQYVALNHKGIVDIIQFYVKNFLNTLTLEEATTKLSFMFTAANKELNDGTRIESTGLSVIEVIKTRNQRAKK